jgi:uncharacterized protein
LRSAVLVDVGDHRLSCLDRGHDASGSCAMRGQYDDEALIFPCEGERLIGVLSRSQAPARRGVLIVVGGPQYRAGSHRQFTLLARNLASRGIATMRFDYRGMGDSSGGMRTFEHIAQDIHAAIDRFVEAVPELEEVVLWGLCDAASAALLYAHSDTRVRGLVLLNPWVRTLAGEAKTILRHYYLRRVLEPALWRRAMTGKLCLGRSVRDLARSVLRSLHVSGAADSNEAVHVAGADLPSRMARGMQDFHGNVMLILSGNDLTAKEFTDAVAASPQWRALLTQSSVTIQRIAEANHTFSKRAWRDQVADWTYQWVQSS